MARWNSLEALGIPDGIVAVLLPIAIIIAAALWLRQTVDFGALKFPSLPHTRFLRVFGALPLIMIIWFARPAIRQQVAGWPVERLKPPSAKKDGRAPPKRVRERRELPPRGFDQWS